MSIVEKDTEETCPICEEVIFQEPDGNWYARIENGNWDERNDTYDYTDVQVHFCFHCGKQLGDRK